MPFGGSSYIPISQGYKGKFSHKGLDAYSLDFPMPWGTPDGRCERNPITAGGGVDTHSGDLAWRFTWW